MEHASKRLYYGTKDGGAWIMNIETQERTPIHVSRTSKMNKTINIHVDQYWDVNQKIFMSKLHGYNVMDYKRCSSFHYTDMSMGTADLTLECTRKGSLEIATAYPLITEAGGVMVSLDGDSLADKYYLKFGVDEYVPVITAATSELAHESVDFFK